MLHATQSRGNASHKSRASGENGHESMATLVQMQVDSEISRVMTAVRAGADP